MALVVQCRCSRALKLRCCGLGLTGACVCLLCGRSSQIKKVRTQACLFLSPANHRQLALGSSIMQPRCGSDDFFLPGPQGLQRLKSRLASSLSLLFCDREQHSTQHTNKKTFRIARHDIHGHGCGAAAAGEPRVITPTSRVPVYR